MRVAHTPRGKKKMRDARFEGWSSNYRAIFGCVNPTKKECHCRVCEKLEEIYDNWIALSQKVMETYQKHAFKGREYKTFGTREAPIPGEW